MIPPCDPKIPFPEIRELIRLARAYVAEEVHFSYVCCAVGPFRDAARIFSAEPAIQKMAEEWEKMAIRVWLEFARIDNPISEEEFRVWVGEQLRVFEPLESNGGIS